MPLNWKLIVSVGLLLVLDSTYKAPESTGAFEHLLMRKLHFYIDPVPFFFFFSLRVNSSTAAVWISPMNVYQTLKTVLRYSQCQVCEPRVAKIRKGWIWNI